MHNACLHLDMAVGSRGFGTSTMTPTKNPHVSMFFGVRAYSVYVPQSRGRTNDYTFGESERCNITAHKPWVLERVVTRTESLDLP